MIFGLAAGPAALCPWDAFPKGTVRFCEDRLCAWIAEPSNTWSSLAYIFVGVWLMVTHTRRARDARLWGVAMAEVLIGLGSFAFHGTGTFAGELLDQAGMFMLSCLILSYAAGKSAGWSSTRTARVYAASTVASTLSLLVIPPAGIPLFALQLVTGLGWEISQWRRAQEKGSYRLLFTGIGIFLVSFFIWTLDISRAVCRPDNHFITGHSVWHVLNSISIAWLYRFYTASFHVGEGEPAEARAA